jgi:methyl-accepting chemotaxis protein/methyl-accepting chemotaxis protein-2 (aspartate sensor receptor)
MQGIFSNWQLRTKVLAAAALAVVLGFGVMIWLIAAGVYQDAERVGLERAREQADDYAHRVEAVFTAGYMPPRHLADAVQGLQGEHFPERKTLD